MGNKTKLPIKLRMDRDDGKQEGVGVKILTGLFLNVQDRAKLLKFKLIHITLKEIIRTCVLFKLHIYQITLQVKP